MESFVELVKIKIKEKDLNVTALAKQIGMNKQYLYSLLKGKRRWNETTIQKVASELDIEILYKAS